MKIKAGNLSFWIFIGLIAGIVAGIYAHYTLWAQIDTTAYGSGIIKSIKDFVGHEVRGFRLLSDIFLSLVKVIVAPLVFSLLLVGLAKTGNFGAMGRIGIKTLAYFTFATLIALTMGLVIVNLFEPGKSLDVSTAAEKIVATQSFDVVNFVLHVFPKNIIEAMSKNDILPIIVFTLFFAAGAAAIGEKGKIVIDFFDAVAHIMLKVTGYVMYFAPLAVFGAVASVIAVHGVGVLLGYVSLRELNTGNC